MKKFLKGSTILIIGDLLTKIISVLYLVPLNLIDSEIITLMTDLLIPFGFFIVLTTLGVNIIFTSELVSAKTKEKTKEVLVDVGIIVIILTTLGVILMTIFTPFIVQAVELDTRYVDILIKGSYILNISIILFAISSYLRAFYMAYGQYKIISITYITEQLIRVGLILLGSYYMFCLHEYNIKYVVLVITFSIIISQISTVLLFLYKLYKGKYYEKFRGTYVFETKNFKYLLMSSFVFFMSSLYITLFDQIDLILLNIQMKNHGYGVEFIKIVKTIYLGLSLKIVMVPISISTAFISVMIKHLGDMEENKVQEFQKVLSITLLYSLVMLYCVVLFGPLVYKILFNSISLGIIKLQAFIIPFYILKNVMSGYVLTNGGKKKTIIVSSVVIIVSKVILNIVFFNLFLFYGYVLSTVSSLVLGIVYIGVTNQELFSFGKNTKKNTIKT